MEHLTELDPTTVADAIPDTTVASAPAESPLQELLPHEHASAESDTITNDTPPCVDYEELAARDLSELRRLLPSLPRISHIGELPGAARYAELRDRGLSVEEAFWAACHAAMTPPPASYDNRSHLHSAVPRGAAGNPAVMSAAELHAAKELFEDLSESEIQKLYSKCRA